MTSKKYNGGFFSYLFGNKPQLDEKSQFHAEIVKSISFIFLSGLCYYMLSFFTTMLFKNNDEYIRYFSSSAGLLFGEILMVISYYLSYYLTFRQTNTIIEEYKKPCNNNIKINPFFICCIGFGLAMLGNFLSACLCSFLNYISQDFSFNVQKTIQETTTAGNLDYKTASESIYSFIILILITVVIPPVVEELIFRKVMYSHLSVFSEKTAVILTTILFMVFHGNVQQMAFALFAGVGFVLIRKFTGSIWYCIGTHFIINLLAFLSQYLSNVNSASNIIFDSIICVFSLFAVASLLFCSTINKNIFSRIRICKGE